HVGGAVDLRAGDLAYQAAGEVRRPGQVVRVADRLDHVRRLQLLAVHPDPRRVVGEVRAGDHPDLAVELDRLGAGVAQLLNRVQQVAGLDLAVRIGQRDPH